MAFSLSGKRDSEQGIRRLLDVQTLKTIFGAKTRPFRHQGHSEPRCEVMLERPAYGLTVFKLHFGKITAKMYTKGECVLPILVIIHNTKELHCGRSLPKSPKKWQSSWVFPSQACMTGITAGKKEE